MIQLLVYGSLLNPESASYGLSRKISAEDYSDVEINGYELAFDVLENVVIENKQLEVCFLNLRKNENGKTVAKTLQVTRPELELLALREKNYDLLDLSSRALPPFSAPVLAFAGKKERLLAPGATPAILERYVEKVKNAMPFFSASFVEDFIKQLNASTQGARLVAGSYRFISPEQNKLSGYAD